MNTIEVKSKEAPKTITPTKVLCIGRNYVDHITELGNEIPDEMVVFFKPNSAISSSLTAYHLDEQLHYEGEICFVYEQGKFSAVGLGLDLTKRALQSKFKKKGLPWERAKAFDGAAVLSDFVPLPKNEETLRLALKINGEEKQAGGVSLMMYKPQVILKELQKFVTLEDGDVVMTGTPKGVGAINTGDNFEAKLIVDKSLTDIEASETLLSCEWVAK
jgi:2-keto-4-pentenoate hydratase/2-oxohepta-3-ene-1,7-dioic acid hydratase in catechol pathway|tara:strand:+ start:65 stop:715 length:651 start_codon:yes stop_codon:yes gene_type:complete